MDRRITDSQGYLLSIIIPTKNRAQYLSGCLESLSDILSRYSNVQLVIQDNSDDPLAVRDLIRKYDCSNLLFRHTTGKLSQTQNSDLALELAEGSYVCYIGDDDTITENLIHVVELLKTNNIAAAVVDCASFIWPDAVRDNGSIVPFSYRNAPLEISFVDASQVLMNELKNGMQVIFGLPRVYHGVVSRKVLLHIKETAGSFFPGPSPDMANAVAVCLSTKTFCRINLPLVVSGRAYNSAGGLGLRGQHYGKIEDVEQLAPDVKDNWDPRIPMIWMGETIWPESALKSLHAMGRDDLSQYLNFGKIYITVLKRSSKNWEYVKPYFSSISTILSMMRALLLVAKQRFINWLQGDSDTGMVVRNDVETLSKARNVTEKYLNSMNSTDSIKVHLQRNT